MRLFLPKRNLCIFWYISSDPKASRAPDKLQENISTYMNIMMVTFRRVRKVPKATTGFVMFACPSAWNNSAHWMGFNEI
jgi:hypothetical protein